MKGKEGVQRVLWIIPVVLAVGFMGSKPAEAYRWGHDDDWHHQHRHFPNRHYDYGRPVVVLPGKYITITIGGQRYYQCNGRYFKRRQWDYVVVPDPVGVIIPRVPHGCRKVFIDGNIYYTYNGNYYLAVSGGYRLVDRPDTRASDRDDSNDMDIQPESKSNDSFSVNIPNSKGGYTAVTLKRSGSGYVGPQGEFYPEFPKVEQLMAMYAK